MTHLPCIFRLNPATCISRLLVFMLMLLVVLPAAAQQRIKNMPGYDNYERMRTELADAFVSGAIQADWSEDSGAFEYNFNERRYRFDVATRESTDIGEATRPNFGRFMGGPARGRQFESATSPDSTLMATYRDRNLWLSDIDGSNERALTTDGSEEARTRNGSGSWVYGEELGQRTAMWWSPDSDRLAYFRFDESEVQDYFLQMDQTKIQSTLDIEAYPKAGSPNPKVDIFVWDRASGNTVRVDIRDGAPLTDDVVGHYAYNVGWTPDGSELLVNRTNRRQNIMEIAACQPLTGACRTVVREEWPASWVDNRPTMRFLEDGQRFIWESERTGWLNWYLYDLDGTLITPLTTHAFEVGNIVRVDEEEGILWYMARSGDNHMKMQLHRVGLDGRGDRRLTDPSLNHAVTPSPDGRWFVDVAQTHDQAPVSRLLDADGRVVATIAESDTSGLEALGKEPVELFTFMAADGTTELHGILGKPADFDPTKSYPLLLSIYSGPKSNGARETFSTGSPLTEYGFLVASVDARSAGGRGKVFLDAIYEKLGITEIDDLAASVKALRERPYVDGTKVGIYGTSYGGYASAMALLRYPDVFQAASAASSVTDWRHYDTIYTERYMYTPQDNTAGYDAGSAMTYAENLEGHLMIYYGTADNNVHPSNSMQLIEALQAAGKSFEVQVGPDRGHTGINPYRMMEFFIERLLLTP